MAGELFKPINFEISKLPQVNLQPQKLPFNINLPPTKMLQNIFSDDTSALQSSQLKENSSSFDVIKFLSENIGAEAMRKTPEIKISEPIFDKLRTDFLSDFDKKIFAELEKMPKADKKKDGIIEWLEKDGKIDNKLFQIDNFEFVREAITEKNIDFILTVIKFLKLNKNINDEDKKNIALAAIYVSNNDSSLIESVCDVLNNSKISNSRKADYILALGKYENYSMEDFKFDLKVDKIMNWIEKSIDKSGAILENRDIKRAEKKLNDGNIDFVLELIKKMNIYIQTNKIKNNTQSDLSKEEITELNNNLIINAVNIVIAAIETSSYNDEYNSIIEKVIAHRFLPDEIKARFIRAIPYNPEFAKDLINPDKLEYKVDDKIKADILECVTNKNVHIIREIIEKRLTSNDLMDVVVAISNDNLDYVREILASDIDDKYKPSILSSVNKTTIKVIRKILEMENLSDDTKSTIIVSMDNSNFKQIYSMVKNGNISEENIEDIIPYIGKRNKYYSKKIINASDLPSKYKGEFIKYINKQNNDIALDVLYDTSINNKDKNCIIAFINKDNKKYAREIIWNENIKSEDIYEILQLTNDETIDDVRKVINNPNIPSPVMSSILAYLIKNRKNISDELWEKILNCKELEPCYIYYILSNIKREYTDLIEKILDDKRINGYYKAEIITFITGSKRNKWIESLIKYDNLKFIVAAIEIDDEIPQEKEDNFREEVLKTLEIENRCRLKNDANPDADNYESIDVDSIKVDKKEKIIENDKNEELLSLDTNEMSDAQILVAKLKYHLEKFPNMGIDDIRDLVLDKTSEEFDKETGKLHTQKRSIVKHFSKNISEEEMIKNSKQGDVIEQNNQLYINEGDKLFKWNMSKEKFDDLFPAGERLLIRQGKIGNCYLIAVLISMMNNPLGRIYLYKSFEQKGEDIICTLRAYKDYGGSIKYPKGKLPKVDTRLDGCKGLQMLEHTDAEIALRNTEGIKHKKGKFLKNYDRLEGGFPIDVFTDITGAEQVSEIDDNFKHKTIKLTLEDKSRDFLDKYINSKNNCCTGFFYFDNKKYNILGNHVYEFRKYDKANDAVIIVNPHNSSKVITIPYSDYIDMNGFLYLCNLEESEE